MTRFAIQLFVQRIVLHNKSNELELLKDGGKELITKRYRQLHMWE